MMFVTERFQLPVGFRHNLNDHPLRFGYNGFGELIFYTRYSRFWKRSDLKECYHNDFIPIGHDSHQETWADCVVRVINGVMSIRKDWYLRNHIHWDNDHWTAIAKKMALSMYNMEWLPPGRGLWAMGTPFIYERGSMSLYNCGFTEIGDEVGDDIAWLMDSLMLGVGVGFSPLRNDSMKMYTPRGTHDFIVPDTREGWVEATRLIINSYLMPGRLRPHIIYDEIRPYGLPIKGFGGLSSGPQPLIELHDQVRSFCERYQERKYYDSIHLKADIANCVGCCVVAGNVRRSAELLLGPIHDETLLDLKDYVKFPERAGHGWMSNNTASLNDDVDFEKLGLIAARVPIRGEPGVANLRNFPQGRVGKKEDTRRDLAKGLNPCGEITLEHREVCNVAETLPTMCVDERGWYDACEYATIYMSTVSLLPTHQASTNRVVARNRRIGCSIIDVSGWKHAFGVHRVTDWLRNGYLHIRKCNQELNGEAGVPEAIKVTTIKPGGTTPKLAGRTPGIGHPTFSYTLRRIRIAINSSVDKLMLESGLPWEIDLFSKNTRVYEYPILQGPAKPADQVSLWEQAMNLVWMQREWADNSVSNTLYFKPRWELVASQITQHDLEEWLDEVEIEDLWAGRRSETIFESKKVVAAWDAPLFDVYVYNTHHEEDDIEAVLSSIIPLIKSVSLLPHSSKGAYAQMPEEGISPEEYERRVSELKPIRWHKLSGSDGVDERYCDSASCER
jgi:ribonucleoside-triphosphate reductase